MRNVNKKRTNFESLDPVVWAAGWAFIPQSVYSFIHIYRYIVYNYLNSLSSLFAIVLRSFVMLIADLSPKMRKNVVNEILN